MLRRLLPAALLWATLSAPLAACSTVQAVPVPGHLDPSLLQECDSPILTASPSSDNDFATDFYAFAEAFVACRDRHHATISAERARGVK